MEEKQGYALPVSEYSERKREERDGGYVQQATTFKKPNSVNVEFPKAMSVTHYQNMRNRAEYKSKEWYLSFAYEKYAEAVKNFYCSMMQAFNNTIHQPIDLPNYVGFASRCTSNEREINKPILEELALTLSEAEKNLIDKIEINRTSMEAICNKHKSVRELRDYAAKAWLVYDNFVEDNFFHSVVDFKTRNADKDMTLDRNIALVCAGHYKAKYLLENKISTYFSTKAIKTPFLNKHNVSARLYKELNSKDIFWSLMTMFNGYNYEENQQTIEEIQNKVTDVKAVKVVEMFKLYADIKDVYKRIFTIQNKIRQGENVKYVDEDYLIEHNVRRDIFVQAETYFNQVLELYNMIKEDKEYSFVVKDCLHFLGKLSNALKEIEPHHTLEMEQRKKDIEFCYKYFSKKDLGSNLSK